MGRIDRARDIIVFISDNQGVLCHFSFFQQRQYFTFDILQKTEESLLLARIVDMTPISFLHHPCHLETLIRR